MLDFKWRQTVEEIAGELQKEIGVQGLNNYDISKIESFLEEADCSIKFEAGDKTMFKDNDNAILLNFKKENYDQRDNAKKVFWAMWNFLSEQLDLTDEKGEKVFDTSKYATSNVGMAADYFARAMLMPQNNFISNVIRATDTKGNINIFKLADQYKVDYTDVLARCRELEILHQ